jgi:hypothetical protein
MLNKTQVQSLFFSPDFIASSLIAMVLFISAPEKIDLGYVKEIFGIAIAVLSIIFSVYFAALAVVITSGDNEFIRFLEEDKI